MLHETGQKTFDTKFNIVVEEYIIKQNRKCLTQNAILVLKNTFSNKTETFDTKLNFGVEKYFPKQSRKRLTQNSILDLKNTFSNKTEND